MKIAHGEEDILLISKYQAYISPPIAAVFYLDYTLKWIMKGHVSLMVGFAIGVSRRLYRVYE